MKSGMMIYKKFIAPTQDLLDDSYISCSVMPVVGPGQIIGIGFSIYDGEHSVAFSFPLGNQADLTIMRESISTIMRGLDVLLKSAEVICPKPEETCPDCPKPEEDNPENMK